MYKKCVFKSDYIMKRHAFQQIKFVTEMKNLISWCLTYTFYVIYYLSYISTTCLVPLPVNSIFCSSVWITDQLALVAYSINHLTEFKEFLVHNTLPVLPNKKWYFFRMHVPFRSTGEWLAWIIPRVSSLRFVIQDQFFIFIHDFIMNVFYLNRHRMHIALSRRRVLFSRLRS